MLRWLQGALSETELDWLFAQFLRCDSRGVPCAAILHADAASQGPAARPMDPGKLPESGADFVNAASDWVRRIITAQRSHRTASHLQIQSNGRIEFRIYSPQLAGAALCRKPAWIFRLSVAGHRRSIRLARSALMVVAFRGQIFLPNLQHAAEDILFAPQSVDAPIQIAGPAESAGLAADAIWFLGADEDSWPAVASTHPFLPLHVQREFGMPHSSHVGDWEFSATITRRLLASAPSVHFSFSLQKGDVESSSSRLVEQFAGEAQPMPSGLFPPPFDESIAILDEDFSTKAYAASHLQGGSAVLSSQSQCPFKAFARARLIRRNMGFG